MVALNSNEQALRRRSGPIVGREVRSRRPLHRWFGAIGFGGGDSATPERHLDITSQTGNLVL
jgi:hypothetical protein